MLTIITNVKNKVVAQDQYSVDYEDWTHHLKGIGGAVPNFWDLFSESPQLKTVDEYPNQYVLPPPNQG